MMRFGNPTMVIRPTEALVVSIDRLVVWVGNWVIGVLDNLRGFVEFLGLTAKAGWKFYRHPHFTTDQLYAIGITSIPLVATTSLFTGAVTAWQAAYLFSDFIPLSYMGIAVGKSVMLEMGPVLTALVVAGRTGAGMTSELGAMSVTEQLDAMDVLGLDRHQFLVAPRIIAGVVMLPILIIISVTVALMGALAVAVVFRDMEPSAFWRGVRVFYDDKDVYVSLIKAVAFGFIITSFGCYSGVRATNGAEGVGRAIEHGVQASAVCVLISNFLIGFFLL